MPCIFVEPRLTPPAHNDLCSELARPYKFDTFDFVGGVQWGRAPRCKFGCYVVVDGRGGGSAIQRGLGW